MRTKILLMTCSLFLFMGISSVNAQNVAWCTKDAGADAGYITALTNAGYTVTSTAFAWSNLDATLATDLNDNYDLVIISKVNNSGEFATPAVWQTVTTPVLHMFDYGARSSRLRYFNTTSVTNTGGTQMVAQVPSHALFNGITLDGSNITGTLVTKFETIGTTDAGNGTILATDNAGTGYILAAEWDAGTEFYTGSGTPVGKRMFLASDYGYSYVGDGDQLFLNAVGYLAPLTPTINLSKTNVEEGLGANVGTFVGKLSTANIASAVLSVYNDGTNDTDNAMFTINNDSLFTVDSLDYETQASYTITIRATGTPTTDKEFTITVLDINEASAPITDITIDNATVAENKAPGTKVGTLIAADTNALETHTFTLIDGDGTNDADNAKFAISGSDVNTAIELDYEAQKTYNIYVKADDGNHNTFTKAITITATNQGTVANIVTNGTFDSDVSPWVASKASTATMVWSNGELKLTIDSIGTNSYSTELYYYEYDFVKDHEYTYSFDGYYDGDSTEYYMGITVGVNGSPWTNFLDGTTDTLTNTKQTFTYTFTAPSSPAKSRVGFQLGQRGTQVYAVGRGDTVYFDNFSLVDNTETNSVPENLQLSSTSVSEGEKLVGTISANDPDEGTVLTYAFATGTGDTDNASFEILNDNELNLKSVAVLGTTFNVRLKATDSNSAAVEETFTITVTNVNEAPTAIALSTQAIDENVAADTEVGTLSATDADAGDAFTYTLATGDDTNDADNGAFTITDNKLSINASPDFETKASYSIYVKVTDTGGLTFEKAFTITIVDVNEAPTAIALSTEAIDENVAADTEVATLTASDVDAGDTFTFTLVDGDGTNDVDNDAFTIAGDKLSINASPDFEIQDTFKIYVKVTDAAGLTFEKADTILIIDVNEAPTNLALSSSLLAEESAIGTFIGTLTADDVDADDVLTYSLATDGTNDADNDKFSISGNELLSEVTGLDYETTPGATYKVLVQVADADGLTTTLPVTITLTDINENNLAPTDIALSANTIAENGAVNAFVAKLSATDADASDTHTFRLLNDSVDNASFKISNDSLFVKTALDYETKASYDIVVEANDGNLGLLKKKITITVTNVNEAPTAIALSNSSVVENKANELVGELSVTDQDTTAATYTYALVAGTGDTNNANFAISNDTLTTKVALDFETAPTQSIRVKVTDDTVSFEAVLSITVTDVAEYAGATGVTITPDTIVENTPIGFVAKLSASDTDASATHSFELAVAAEGDTLNNDKFSVSNDSLFIKESPNYELLSAYGLNLKVTNGTFTVFSQVSLTIIDINEAPTTIALSDSSVTENVAGEIVGVLSAFDEDANSVLTYSLVDGEGSTENANFVISGDTLMTALSLDYETTPVQSIRIAVSDGELADTAVFAINVLDVVENVAPTDIILSATSVDENSAAGIKVAALTTVDADTVESHTFSLAVGDGTNDADNAAFTISDTSLVLAETPDFEIKASYSIYIAVEDTGGNVFAKAITITVNDLNEAPTDIALSNATIVEELPVGAVVGTLSATDADADASFTFELKGGNDDAMFEISGDSLLTNSVFDYETNTEFSIGIEVNDGVNTFSKTFTIEVQDSLETAISDFEMGSISAYPNPVVNELTIEGVSKGADVNVYSISGSLMKKVTLFEGEKTVDFSDLYQGIYILEIKTTNNTFSRFSITKE
jgi:hypothetical protein